MANITTAAQAASRAVATAERGAVSAGATSMRTVGVSRIEPAVVRSAATKVASLSKTKKDALRSVIGNKKVVLGGAAIGGAALVGYGADELFELLNSASPEELSDFLSLIDSVDQKTGNAVVEVYNAAVNISDLDNDFSDDRSDDGFVSQAPVSGLGLQREQIEAQQIMQAQYDSLRRALTYEQILNLQFLLAHAKPEDISTLEDLRRFGRGYGRF